MKGRVRNKNISSYRKKMYILLLGIAGIVSSYYLFVAAKQCSYFVIEKFFDIKHINVEFASIYSTSLKNELQTYIEHAFMQKNLFSFNFEKFACELKKEFPIVKDISWHQKSSDNAYLSIEGYDPAYLVNDTLVLLRHGICLPKDMFTEYTSPLAKLNIDHIKHHKPEYLSNVITFADGLKPRIWKDYEIFYANPSEIVLVPKKQGSVLHEIITDQKMTFNVADVQRIERVVGDMVKKKVYPSKKNSKVVFDIRLRNRVLVKKFEGAKAPFLQKRRGA